MIGFAMLGTNDIERARGFYDQLMPLLGAALNAAWSDDVALWYMTAPNAPMLALRRPRDGKSATVGNGSMVALIAGSREAVGAVHAKVLALGGADEGSPGNRSDEPDDLYRAYFRDLDGNKFMVFTMAPG